MRSAAPTTLSISARAPASTAARSWSLRASCRDILDYEDSLTGAYLSGSAGNRAYPARRTPRDAKRQLLVLSGATGNNLQSVTLEIPLGLLTCITGVSGSGKSTLINGTLYPIAATELNGATTLTPAPHSSPLRAWSRSTSVST